MLVAAYTLLYKSHVSIDIIYGRYSPRTRGILDIITYLVFFFPFCIIVFYQGIIFAQTSWSIGETSESAALRIVPLIKTVIPVTFGLLLIQGLANLIRSIMLVARGKEI
jgi:TRAP-type mannitol/chloroaromatic compound transport system permease small subunit